MRVISLEMIVRILSSLKVCQKRGYSSLKKHIDREDFFDCLISKKRAIERGFVYDECIVVEHRVDKKAEKRKTVFETKHLEESVSYNKVGKYEMCENIKNSV